MRARKRAGSLRSGINHLRYDHQHRPCRIEVACPRCDACALAVDKLINESTQFVSDTSAGWNEKSFQVTCRGCGYYADHLSYCELPPLFHRIYLRGDELFAWNLPHLQMIYTYLQNGDIAEHPYRFFATYIHGKWKRSGLQFARAIEKHLTQHELGTFKPGGK